MTKPAIQVERLSKEYRIGAGQSGHYRTLRESLVTAARQAWRGLGGVAHHKRRPLANAKGIKSSTFWALNDISFVIQPGEVVGIIGRNGAGKSTLFKVLSSITEPTRGRVAIRGRVASLLEVGTGFHHELTGRENVYLNGSILGMSRREIAARFDAIVDFAEVEQFLDTPVKRYSSGMYVRLAFAVASQLQPEIMLVDEILAVGDQSFQKKCLARMDELAKSGRTVVFVSHNMATIERLCHRVAVLDHGRLIYHGDTKEGTNRYLSSQSARSDGDCDLSHHPNRRRGCLKLLKRLRLLDRFDKVSAQFPSGEPMAIELQLDRCATDKKLHVEIRIQDAAGSPVFTVANFHGPLAMIPFEKPQTLRCFLKELPLAPGQYHVTLDVCNHCAPSHDMIEHAATFEVNQGDFFGNGHVIDPRRGRSLVRSQWTADAG